MTRPIKTEAEKHWHVCPGAYLIPTLAVVLLPDFMDLLPAPSGNVACHPVPGENPQLD